MRLAASQEKKRLLQAGCGLISGRRGLWPRRFFWSLAGHGGFLWGRGGNQPGGERAFMLVAQQTAAVMQWLADGRGPAHGLCRTVSGHCLRVMAALAAAPSWHGGPGRSPAPIRLGVGAGRHGPCN